MMRDVEYCGIYDVYVISVFRFLPAVQYSIELSVFLGTEGNKTRPWTTLLALCPTTIASAGEERNF